MTDDKRFTLTNPKNAFQEMKCGINDEEKTLTFNEVIDLLNKLHEEIEVLKRQLRIRKEDALETLNDLERAYENNKKALSNIERLEEEKEKLKKENKRLKHDLNDTEKELQEYKDFMSLG